jgi:hypothetical protein
MDSDARSKSKALQTIYFILANDEFVKIGSSSNVEARLEQLQSACPYIGTLAESLQDEWDVHARFHHLRHNGEWFRYEGELKEYCDSLRDLANSTGNVLSLEPPQLALKESGSL